MQPSRRDEDSYLTTLFQLRMLYCTELNGKVFKNGKQVGFEWRCHGLFEGTVSLPSALYMPHPMLQSSGNIRLHKHVCNIFNIREFLVET